MDRIFTIQQVLFIFPFIFIAVLITLADKLFVCLMERARLWQKVLFAVLGFLFFGIVIGMLIGQLLPDGLLKAWDGQSRTTVLQETIFIFLYNFASYFLFIPIANLFRIRSIPYGLVVYWTLAWGWGMTVGSNSLAVASSLTLYENLVGFFRVTFWEFFAGAMTWAATSNHYRWSSERWFTLKSMPVNKSPYKLKREEIFVLFAALAALLFAAFNEAIMVTHI